MSPAGLALLASMNAVAVSDPPEAAPMVEAPAAQALPPPGVLRCGVLDGTLVEVADAERKIRVNIQRSFAIQLQALSMDFRKKQKAFMGRVKAQKQGGDSTFDFLAQDDVEIDMGFNDDQLAAVDHAEVMVQDRDQEIVQIARSIEELSTIFKELAVLVIDQGTILDRIDYNMEQVVERTKQGMKELVHAEKHQKSSRPIKCIAFLILLICIMIAILVNKHTGGKDKD